MKRLKRIIFLLLVMILSTISFQKVSAAEANLPDGFLVGDENGITLAKDGDYFFNLDNLQPGDSFTRNLTIKNFRDEAYELKLLIEPKSKTGKIDLIENMSMQILLGDQEVYQGNLRVHQNGTKEVSFGVIAARTEKTATIHLTMNNIEEWNKLYYSGPSEAEVQWQFVATSPTAAVTETPDGQTPATPRRSAGLPNTSGRKGLLPQTGDILMGNVALLGLVLIALVCFTKMHRKRTEYK